MDLALNNLQKLICHKTLTTNQPSYLISPSTIFSSFFLFFLSFFFSFFLSFCLLVAWFHLFFLSFCLSFFQKHCFDPFSFCFYIFPKFIFWFHLFIHHSHRISFSFFLQSVLSVRLNLLQQCSVTSLRVFHISFSWWSFMEVWGTASHLKSSRTFLSILADHSNTVVWTVSTHPLSNFYNSGINPLMIVSRTPVTIGINITFMFHSFFNCQARLKNIYFFLLSFSFILWSVGTAKSIIRQVLFFYWLI